MMPWSQQQQRLLRAMGYALYERAAPGGSLAASDSPSAQAPAGEFARLRRALQLAARGRDVSAWVGDLAALRGDARAKRALWPRLRALRRAAGGATPEVVDDP